MNTFVFFVVTMELLSYCGSLNIRETRQVRIQFGDTVFMHHEDGGSVRQNGVTRRPPNNPRPRPPRPEQRPPRPAQRPPAQRPPRPVQRPPSPSKPVLRPINSPRPVPRPVASPAGTQCTTSDGQPGRCVSVFNAECSGDFFSTIGRGPCNGIGSAPMVCCPSSVVNPQSPQIHKPVIQARPPVQLVTKPPTPPKITQPTPKPFASPPRENPSSGGSVDLFPTDCGVTRGSTLKVVGGQESSAGSWPWMAAIYAFLEGKLKFHCGGVVINNRYILTAAHCIEFRDGTVLKANELQVRLGDLDLTSNSDGLTPVEYKVSEVIYHEDFRSRVFLNDIALLRLDSVIQYTDFIKPICVPYDRPSLTNQDFTGLKGIVAGWGKTSSDASSFSDVLREALLPIWSNDDCDRVYRGQIISQHYICSGHVEGGEDACQGDSGGPFMITDPDSGHMYMLGIVSFGFDCARPNFPGVYTRVPVYTQWITKNMRA